MTDTIKISRELLADLLSSDREKRIPAERTVYALLANARPPEQPVAGEREAFKLAMNAINKTVGQWLGGKFANPYAQAAWEGWQARAALSSASKEGT